MLNRFFLTLALVAASPAMLLAQDIFLAFDQANVNTSANGSIGTAASPAAPGTPGSAFIYSANGNNLGALEIDFSVDDTSVVELTGATIFNPVIGAFGTRFDQILDDPANPIDETVAELNDNSSGRIFGTSIRGTSQGLNGAFSFADPTFDATADAFLIGQIDFNVLGTGTANFTLASANDTAFADLGFTVITVDLAGGSLDAVVGVPEPGSVSLLALGLVGFVARRRRRA